MATKKYIREDYPHFLHGADYNPEQWKDYPDILEEDMRLMKLAKMNEMTIGVFSWAELEPEEGVFDFSFMDKAFDMIEANGGKIILATPSGARPKWLADKYPEVLRTDEKRVKMLFGKRHNHCYTSPVYREKIAIINRKLAERYGKRPSLYAWHVSNEVNGECHCEYCRAAFIEWCRKKYNNDIDLLNHQWWTTFWSHKYTSFEQIEPPSSIGENLVHGLVLDWKRFCTHQTVDFMLWEQKPLRELTPNIPTTANLMGLFSGVDYKKLAESVDFVSWDSYPDWGVVEGDKRIAIERAFTHDHTRGLKGENFLLMESTPSLVNWKEINKLKRPGIHLVSSLQAVAHGSDSVQYFQFRKSRGSSEKMHGAVVDHCGHENTRVFRDIQSVGDALEKIDEVCGTIIKSEVAVVRDTENLWAISEIQGMQKSNKHYTDTCIQHYYPMWEKGINTDVIFADDDFSPYKLVILPMLYMVTDEMIDKIEKYVREGGRVIATYTLGQANENDLVHLGGFPAGKLKDVFGIWAEELDTLYPNEANYVKYNGIRYEAKDYCEIIHANEAEVLAEYDSDFYAGMPAATVNNYGEGKAYYMAFRDKKKDFIRALTDLALNEAGVAPCMNVSLPDGTTAHVREGDGVKYYFVECYNANGAEIALDGEYYDMLEGKNVTKLDFSGVGVAVLKK